MRLRLRLAHELIKAYELPQHMRMCACGTAWQPASPADIAKFHTDMYVHFLQQLTSNAYAVADEAPCHVLNQSVCFSESAWCARALRRSLGARDPHMAGGQWLARGGGACAAHEGVLATPNAPETGPPSGRASVVRVVAAPWWEGSSLLVARAEPAMRCVRVRIPVAMFVRAPPTLRA